MTDEPVRRASFNQPLVNVFDHQVLHRVEVVPFNNEIQRPVHGCVRFSDFEPCLVSEARVARRIYVTLGLNH